MFIWVTLKENVRLARILRIIIEACLNREFPRGDQRNYHTLKIFAFLHGLMTWLVMQRNVRSDIVSWQTKQLNIYTKSQNHALTTTNSRKKK